MDTLSIVVIEGTTRKLRKSIHAARFIAEIGKKIEGVEITFVDPQELNLPYDGNDEDAKDPRYTEITAKADAFFVVTPEYNHSFPGSLKRVLDSELKNYNHKPIAFAGVSDGNWGGVRAIEALVPAVRETGLVVLSFDVQFPRVQDIFNEKGELQDEKYTKRVMRVYDELIWMAKTLKWGRENL
jgi:NAD(P)H-dependent FMN reductase